VEKHMQLRLVIRMVVTARVRLDGIYQIAIGTGAKLKKHAKMVQGQ